MPHSYGATLILFWKIPLISYVAHNTKEEMLRSCKKKRKKKKTLVPYFISSHCLTKAQVQNMLVDFPA